MPMKLFAVGALIATLTAPEISLAQAMRLDGPPDVKGYPREATASWGHASVYRTHGRRAWRPVQATGYPPGAVTTVR
jgi:hypothetical protein